MFWLIEKIADFCHWRAKRAEAQATAAIERARKWLQRERSITNGAIENGTEKES